MRFAVPAIFLFATTSVFAQTAATKPKTAVHHTATAAAKAPAAPAASPEANAPGIPVATGPVETLYALRYIDLVVGTGELAVPRKWYTVNYTGWLTDGTKFDSSVDRGVPFPFPYGAHRVISAWDTGFEGMRVGGKRRLIAPYQLAYGDQANQAIPAKATLIFDVELLGMSDTAPAPPAAPKTSADPAAEKPVGEPSKTGADVPPSGAAAPGAPAPKSAPGNPGHPDPAKLPGAPPSGE